MYMWRGKEGEEKEHMEVVDKDYKYRRRKEEKEKEEEDNGKEEEEKKRRRRKEEEVAAADLARIRVGSDRLLDEGDGHLEDINSTVIVTCNIMQPSLSLLQVDNIQF